MNLPFVLGLRIQLFFIVVVFFLEILIFVYLIAEKVITSLLFTINELGHSDVNTELTIEVIGSVIEREGAICDVHVSPIVVTQGVDLFELLVMREINRFVDYKAHTILVLQLVDLLHVVHDEEALDTEVVFDVICNMIGVSLKCHEPRPRKLVNLLLRDFVRL